MDNVSDRISCLYACDDGLYVALWKKATPRA